MAKSKKGTTPDTTGSAVTWLRDPEDHDFPAAADFLSLLAHDDQRDAVVAALEAAPTVKAKAKDLLRASRLPLLPQSNVHVASDLAKIHAGKPLSPVLAVRGDLAAGRPLQIADGYHRVCASYYVDENTDISVRIVDA